MKGLPAGMCNMKAKAAAGVYHSPSQNRDYSKVQLLTVERLLTGAQVEMPPTPATFKVAPKAQ